MGAVHESHALIEAYPLGAWVIVGDNGLVANHIPFLLDRSRGEFGMLVGHLSRENSVWTQLKDSAPSVVMFQGPQAYITPSWYPSKAEDGKVVPTWNYNVVHAHGVAKAVQDADWLYEMLVRLTAFNEAPHVSPWHVTDAPAEFIRKLARAIVGIEIPIDRIEGKRKASQDEALQDRWGTVTGLAAQGTEDASRMAVLVRQAIEQDEHQSDQDSSVQAHPVTTAARCPASSLP